MRVMGVQEEQQTVEGGNDEVERGQWTAEIAIKHV